MNERIKEIRKELNYTMETFGKKIGVTKAAISNIENGNRNVSEQLIVSICREFNVNEKWLRTGEGEMFVEVEREVQIARFVGDALKGEEDSFKKRLIQMLASLDESEWELLEKMVGKMQEKRD